MRITNNIIRRNALGTLQGGMRQINQAQTQISTGLRFQKASEDPFAANEVMRTGESLRALEQYRRNIRGAEARVAAEDSVLSQLTDVLTRAKEIGVAGSTATMGQPARAQMAAELEEMFKSAVELGNAQVAGEFIFGGDAATRPFAATGNGATLGFTSSTPAGSHRVQIGDSQQMIANHSGTEIFETSGSLVALRDLTHGLVANDQDAIRTAMAALDLSFGQVQSLVAETGARANQLQLTSANLDALEVNLQTFKSNLQEVDLEKAMTDLVGRQTAFQAAMLATSRVMGMNLTDYLR